jgi:transposase
LAAKAEGAERLPAETLAAIRARYQGHVAQGQHANPRNPNSRAQSDAFNLLDRLDRYADDVLRFTVDFAVPFSNNQAEREVRMVKLFVNRPWTARTARSARVV